MTAEIQEKTKQEKLLEILLVDDEQDSLNLNEDIFKRNMNGREYKIDTALNAFAALEKIEMGDFDLVITDFGMPFKSGAELYCDLLAKKPEWQHRVIIISGYSAGFVREQLAKKLIPEDKMPLIMDKLSFGLNIDYVIKTYLS